jgi:hypothetical protein
VSHDETDSDLTCDFYAWGESAAHQIVDQSEQEGSD